MPRAECFGGYFYLAQLPDEAWHSALSNSCSGTARRTKGTGWGDAGGPPVSGIKVIPEPKRSEGAASPPCRFFTGSRMVSSAVLPHRQAALLGTLAELLGQ